MPKYLEDMLNTINIILTLEFNWIGLTFDKNNYRIY